MIIIEDIDNETVKINDTSIEGFLSDERCSKCSHSLIMYRKYDAYFCAYCNEWAEGICSDTDCFYCKNRPKNPCETA